VFIVKKWVLAFLVLANALTFFGFVMLEKPQQEEESLALERAMELRFVTEVPDQALAKRSEPLVFKESNKDGLCYEYQGIDTQADADQIAAFMTEQGLEPLILLDDAQGARAKLPEWQEIGQYRVRLQSIIDEKLINKINDVLRDAYKSIKIEKKVCKGVASQKRDQ
jgi:hypothetical protein